MKYLKSIELRVVPMGIRRIYRRGTGRYCPLCESHVHRFLPFGLIPRPEAQCPVCYSLERHRLIWQYFHTETNLFDGRARSMFHVAPEPQLSRLLCGIPNLEYISADLYSRHAMVKMDVTAIEFPSDRFDVVYCSHVLEHVPDDRKAMSELFRVLKPGGWAILQVPIEGETTHEDPSITDPEERERVFGQKDHVRIYGKDYVDRLRGAGFTVTVDPFIERFSTADQERLGLGTGEDIYFCQKLPS